MAKDDIDDLEKKKQELEQELQQIQGELDSSVHRVQDDITNKLNPSDMIRKHPLPLVGGAALIGFLLGHRGRSDGESGEARKALVAEIKKLATRKAISFATDYIEELIEEKTEEHLSNGTE